MARAFFLAGIIGSALTLAIPSPAQRGPGGGVGRVAGSVTGAAAGTVNSSVSAPAGKSANTPNSGNHSDGEHGSSAGRGPLASADVGLRVSQNAQLSAQLQPLLPPGTTLTQAAMGFRNEGQFIAALHVSHNLNIPFDQLKAKMTGTNPVSLGRAIEELRPSLDETTVKDNTKLADRQAERDLRSKGKPEEFAARIGSNTALSSRVQALLPPGMTLQSAAAGFKNEGQFIATLEAAKNLSLSFTDLKDRVTAEQSLGQAIHALNPKLTEAASEGEAIHAQEQAKLVRAGTSE